jgi:hypothetical protein
MSQIISDFIFNTLLKPLDGYKTLIGYALLIVGAVVKALAGLNIPYLPELSAFITGEYWAAAIAWTGIGLAHKAVKE